MKRKILIAESMDEAQLTALARFYRERQCQCVAKFLIDTVLADWNSEVLRVAFTGATLKPFWIELSHHRILVRLLVAEECKHSGFVANYIRLASPESTEDDSDESKGRNHRSGGGDSGGTVSQNVAGSRRPCDCPVCRPSTNGTATGDNRGSRESREPE